MHDPKVELWLPLTIDPRTRRIAAATSSISSAAQSRRDDRQARADLERCSSVGEAHSEDARAEQTNHRLRIDPLQDDMVGGVTQRCGCCRAPSGSCCSSRARISRTCCSRAPSRGISEFAMRTALGAGRGRAARQFLTEGVVLAMIGGAVGVCLAPMPVCARCSPPIPTASRARRRSPRSARPRIHAGVAVVTGVFFGLAPLLHLRSDGEHRVEGRRAADDRDGAARIRARPRRAEVALAVVLVVGAGLLLRSFWNLMSVDAGFNASAPDDVRPRAADEPYPEPADAWRSTAS